MDERAIVRGHGLRFCQAQYGYTALGICIFELIIVWGGIAIFSHGSRLIAPRWAQDGFALVYFVGLCSIVLSIIGLFRDKFRLIALFALALGIANVALCGVPLLV